MPDLERWDLMVFSKPDKSPDLPGRALDYLELALYHELRPPSQNPAVTYPMSG
jgi:hypothetical protein